MFKKWHRKSSGPNFVSYPEVRIILIDGKECIRLPLSKGQFATVDVKDYPVASKYRWYAWWSKDTKSYYAIRKVRLPVGRYKAIPMVNDITGKTRIDHINHDTLDNRRINLRPSNRSEQQCNRRRYKNNTTGFKGVTQNSKTGRFLAGITKNYIHMHLGTFATAEDAYAAYCVAAKELHRDFACTE